MVDFPRATVQGMTSDPRGTEVQVEVVGPKALPEGIKELRARATALFNSGVLPAARDSIEDLTMGEIEGFTVVDKEPVTEDRGQFQEAALYTVIVKGEQ